MLSRKFNEFVMGDEITQIIKRDAGPLADFLGDYRRDLDLDRARDVENQEELIDYISGRARQVSEGPNRSEFMCGLAGDAWSLFEKATGKSQ